MLQPALVATKVVCLTHAVSADELKDDEGYEEILDDMRQECSKFGNFGFILLVCHSKQQHIHTNVLACLFCVLFVLQPFVVPHSHRESGLNYRLKSP